MSCKVENRVNGKESVLLQELLEAFNGDQNAAEVAYSRVEGSDFKKVFGDWKQDYENTGASEQIALGKINPLSGEPKLYKKEKTNQHYFVDKDGDKFFIDKVAFSEFEAQEVEDVVKYLMYQYISDGGQKSLNEFEESKLESNKIMNSIDSSISAYKESIKGANNEATLLERIELVDKHKSEFKAELINAISSLGKEFVEVAEEDKGGGVNIKEAFESNAKDSATVNTKIFLSTIESRVFDPETNLPEGVAGGFLQTTSFEDFNEVWTTVQNLLVDKVGYGHGHNVYDIYDIMYSQLEDIHEAKPWINDLLSKLKNMPRNKQTEFVQAFSSTKLNFIVTEVDGSEYKVINATATNSRQSQITSGWSNNFHERFVVQGAIKNDQLENLKETYASIKQVFAEFNQEVSTLNDIRDGDLKMDMEREAIQNAVASLHPILEFLGMEGVYDEDFNNIITLNGGINKQIQTIAEVMKGLDYMMKDTVLKDGTRFINPDGSALNPFDEESNVKVLAYAVGFRETDIADAGILANNGKMYFSFSKPTYLSNKINEWKNDPEGLLAMATDPSKKNSIWLKHLLALDVPEGPEREYKSKQRVEAMTLTLASSFKSKNKNDGVENTDITLDDQILDNLTKLLGSKVPGQKSYFPTIVAADKSRRIEISSEGSKENRLNIFDSQIAVYNGSLNIGQNTIDAMVGYFLDEYSRMQKVARENSELPDNQKIVYYHGDEGNGLLSQIFPEFSHNGTDPRYKNLRDSLYKDGKPLLPDTSPGFSSVQKKLLEDAITKDITDRLNETVSELDRIAMGEDWTRSSIDSKLIKAYTNNKGEYKEALAGDYLINGIIASVEYTKLFSGDPAFYKNTADLIKRIPGTYTDGLPLRLKDSDSLIFNQATIQGVEVSSRYVDMIKKSLKDKNIAKAYELFYDKNGKPKGGVNTTDAQAWITPNRWRFLKNALGQWSPLHDVVFDKMKTGQSMSPQEAKIAAQPLKGVYFEINEGRPVYLKYSQAVLIPSLVKGTPMEALLAKMTTYPDGTTRKAVDEIHEVITIDGVKVGAIAPTKMHLDDTTDIDPNFELNPVVLSNRGWKLQQDLPIKLMHETNVGSQIQKNILEGLSVEGTYEIDGVKISGANLMQKIHDTVSELSNIGKSELIERFGIDEDNRITNKEPLYQAIIEEFRTRDGAENIIAALEKEMPFDAIPQIRGKVESIFNSIANKALTKISTNGGSFIQVSPFGLETIISDSKLDANKLGVSEIYSKLGNKTVSENVIMKSVYQQEGVAYAKSIGGIFSMRVNSSEKHFGNPFSSVPAEIAKGLIATKSTKESVVKYINWVLNSENERAKWIREQLKSGELKNKPILYYKELGEPSHATALDYLINKYDWVKSNTNTGNEFLSGIDDIDSSIYNKNVNSTPEGTKFVNVYRAEGVTVEKSKLPKAVQSSAGSWFTPNKSEVERYAKMGNRKIYKIAIPKSLYDNIIKSREGNIEMSKGEIQLPNNISQLKTEVKEVDTSRKSNSGIKIVSKNYNGIALLPPRIEKGKVLPGQAMIPHSEAMKIFRENNIDVSGKSMDELISLLDPSALELITYRIPNQGMSSNDYLEIVGILPPGMADSIIVYDGLPAKTGSDFDIDKLFVMQYNVFYNRSTGKVEKLTEENKNFYPKNKDETEIQALRREKDIAKKIVQNTLVSTYKAILNSPLNYDNMMRSIDGAFLKDDINSLFPASKMRNLELFSPIQQLKTKFEYISGKFGVGQTANQLVDHVLNQSLNIRLDHWIGIGNSRVEDTGYFKDGKNNKTVTFFDTETKDVNSISRNISAFLNAYVDIAKDPYIARGNHNSITANVTFMLLRAGADLKWINRFIGQPILKDLVDVTRSSEGITSIDLTIEKEDMLGNVFFQKVSPEDYLANKYKFGTSSILTPGTEAFEISKLGAKELEDAIKSDERDPFFDHKVLQLFQFLQQESKRFSEGVTAAKSDTAGAGGSNVERMVNNNKVKKILNDGFLIGYEQKFQGTMLGTYKNNTLDWLGDVVSKSNLFFSGLPVVERTFDNIYRSAGKGDILTNKDFAKALDNAFYSYILSGTELFKNNSKDYSEIIEKIPNRVYLEKNNGSDNYLINELEIENRDKFKFLGINSKNKPSYYQNKISRAWLQLYNDPAKRQLAIDLTKYAYAQSGFQNNLNQFFSYIPHEILKDANISSEIKGLFKTMSDITSDDNFVDQFMRHNYDNPKIVSPISIRTMDQLIDSEGKKIGKDSGFLYSPSKNEIGFVDNQKQRVYPKFVTANVNDQTILYKQQGFKVVLNDSDMEIEVPVYFRTYKLGVKMGRNRIFEYERIQDSSKKKDSNIIENKVPKHIAAARNKAFVNLRDNDPLYFSELQSPMTSNKNDANTLNQAEDLVSSGGQIEMNFDEPSTFLSPEALARAMKDKKDNGEITEEGCN